MDYLQVLCVLIAVTVSEGKRKIVKEAYYIKQTEVGTANDVNALECGVRYPDEEFGGFKLSVDGLECTTTPWSWFDTQATETGYLHHKKYRMKQTYNPPLKYFTNETIPIAYFKWPFPFPMLTDSKVEVYFIPTIPFYKIAFTLQDAASSDIICQFKAYGFGDYVQITSKVNGLWNSNLKTIEDDIPFVTETTYKVTIKATLTTYQVYVDDTFIVELDHARSPNDVRFLKVGVSNSIAQISRVESINP